MSDAFPRLRPGLGFVSQVIGGSPTVVVKDPVRMQYFRFGEREAWLMKQMDGSRSLADIVEGLRQRFGVDAAVASLEAFVRRLKELRLVERTPEERRVLIAESLRRERRLKLKGHGNTLFRMRFSFGDPDRLFSRLVGPLRFCWTPAFVLLSLVAFAVYVVVVAAHWPAVGAGIAAMY
ncbi:MAG TPA: PqqD family protein, partial [Longimicrobiales bacterium]|nr:PqqD family protein [Longimicrobiales bacterium]